MKKIIENDRLDIYLDNNCLTEGNKDWRVSIDITWKQSRQYSRNDEIEFSKAGGCVFVQTAKEKESKIIKGERYWVYRCTTDPNTFKRLVALYKKHLK